MQTDLQTIQYGTKEIDFHLTWSDRKTLEIAVYPDQSVWVTAPRDAPMEKIEEKVRKRAKWIVRQKRYFTRFEPSDNGFEYISGETHRYLGRQYRLKVTQIETGEKESVKLNGKYIHVRTLQKEHRIRIKRLLNEWYRSLADRKFRERFEHCYELLKRYDIPMPELQLYYMEKRWGSYTPSGRIFLNPELIKHPVYCIDYVIIHELCHTKHPNHDKKFYQLLNKVLPDWQRRKHRLEGYS